MLNVVSVSDAIKTIDDNFNTKTVVTEEVSISVANGRISACDIISREDVPSFSRSTMDGYALKACDTFGASNSVPCMLDIIGEVFMGEEADFEIHEGQCVRISTGGMLPEGADAVIPVEVTEEEIGEICLAYKSVSPFENVTKKGDDVSDGQVVLTKGTRLSAVNIGVLAAMGYEKVSVIKKPLVGIISTGDELVDISEKAGVGKIRDVNTYLLSAMADKFGCNSKAYGIVKDDYQSLYNAIKIASDECDVVLISGGSSAGARDMTSKVISELGEVFIHGIAMKPGKPTIIGKISDKAVFGLPGHPAACFFVTQVIAKSMIDRILEKRNEEAFLKMNISENISSNNGREEFICVRIENDTAYPLFAKSGIISLLSRADGFIRINRDCEGIRKGEEVKVYTL